VTRFPGPGATAPFAWKDAPAHASEQQSPWDDSLMSLRVKAGAALVLLVIAGVVLLVASGLSLGERRDIGAAQAAIETNIPDGDRQEVRAAVDRLIEICRANPDAQYDTRSMREVLRDASETLGRYWPHLADRLLWESERGLGPIDVGTR
jgi:hypothetical protein